MTTPPHILIVEDEPSILDTISYPLESDGCRTSTATTGGQALKLLAAEDIDLVVLDIGLPDMSGFDICRRIRETSQIPILFLTARSEEIDRVVGLEMGGDDYVAKPFSPRELSARVRSILRRTQTFQRPVSPGQSPSSSGLCLDLNRFEALLNDLPLGLSRYEFRILQTLLAQPGRVFSRAQLMDAAWEEPDTAMERTVDTHIKTLRGKIRAAALKNNPAEEYDLIRTHRGLGYSLEEHT